MTGPRLVKGASVADFATHLGGFGAHGAAISAGLRSVCTEFVLVPAAWGSLSVTLQVGIHAETNTYGNAYLAA